MVSLYMTFSCFVDYISFFRKSVAFSLISRQFCTACLENYRVFVPTTASRSSFALDTVRWGAPKPHQVMGRHIRNVQIFEKLLYVGAG